MLESWICIHTFLSGLMLTFQEFNKLPEQDQYTYVWNKCQFLANYVEDEMFYANLYYAGSFFIERGRPSGLVQHRRKQD